MLAGVQFNNLADKALRRKFVLVRDGLATAAAAAAEPEAVGVGEKEAAADEAEGGECCFLDLSFVVEAGVLIITEEAIVADRKGADPAGCTVKHVNCFKSMRFHSGDGFDR